MVLALLVRFIPTCVGNIFSAVAMILFPPVHPHVCGEHLNGGLSVLRVAGSSPRVWGTFVVITDLIPVQLQRDKREPKAPVH